MLLLTWLALFFLFITLLSPQSMLQHLRGFLPVTAASIKGQWVGHIDIYGIQDPWHRTLSKPAVIRLKLGTQDYFLNNYDGTGELTIAGETPQPFHLKTLSMASNDPKREFRTGLWLNNFPANDPKDLVSGGFHGQWKPGESLSIERDLFTGYDMKGVLVKGTQDDYNSLVQTMNAAGSKD